jgi:hypothetical protein
MEVRYTHMRNDMSNNITKIAIRLALAASLSLGLLVAHNGEEHVNGTVAKISETSVTVNTTAGKMVEVAFDAKTAFTKASQPFAKSDLKVGDRVVIHAGEVHEKLIAHTVQVGAAAAKAAAHGDHSAAEHSKAEHGDHHQ